VKRKARRAGAKGAVARASGGTRLAAKPSSGTRARPWFALLLPVLLVLVVVAAYWNSFQSGFVLDNRAVILDDPRVKSVSPENLGAILTKDYWPHLVTGTYRPLTTLSYLLNYTWFGSRVEPWGYHAVNLALHLANVLLVYYLLSQLCKSRWPAWVAAAVFGVHPIGTEVVTNIVGRADLLATLSVLLGLWFHVQAARPGVQRGPWLVGLACSTFLGVFAKESAVTLLGVLVCYDLLFRPGASQGSLVGNFFRHLWRHTRQSYWVVLAPIAVLFLARGIVYSESLRMPTGMMDNPLVGTDFLTARMTAAGNLLRLAGLWIWPANLSCDYSFNQLPAAAWSLGDAATLWGTAALVAGVFLGWLVVRGWRNYPLAVFLLGFFIITILPTSNFIILIGSVMGDRFLYLPGVGLAGLVALGGAALARRWNLAGRQERAVPAWGEAPVWMNVVVAAVVLALAARTWARNRDWMTDETLWTAAARVSPNSYKVHASLAGVLLGNEQQPHDLDGCLREAERALAIVESAPPPVSNQPRVFLGTIGNYYRIKGDSLGGRTADGSLRPGEASLGWYGKALKVLERAAGIDKSTNQRKRQEMERRGQRTEAILDSGYSPIYLYLGDVLLRMAQYDKSRQSYEYYRHLNPAKVDAHLKLATLELARSAPAAAERALMQALAVDPRQQLAWQRLKEIHLKHHPDCQAVAHAGERTDLRLECETFRTAVCDAYAELVDVFLQARQVAGAETLRRAALALGFCPIERFKPVPQTVP